jgi:hypothetical protein
MEQQVPVIAYYVVGFVVFLFAVCAFGCFFSNKVN